MWDRDQVVYLTTCFGPVNRPLSQLSGLATLDPPSGRNKRFRPYRFSLFFNGTFSFSPDGARGVISSGGLYSRLEWIAQHAVVPIRLRLAVAYAPSWSPDGKLILFGGVPKPHSDADVATLPTSLYTFHPNNPQSLHLVIAGLKDFRPSGAGWMPNSTWAVVGMKPPGLPRGIWIIDVSNGRKALLATGPEFGRPAVAPDGRSVAVGVGVEADLDRSLHEKPPTKVGIEIIPLPPERLLGKLLR